MYRRPTTQHGEMEKTMGNRNQREDVVNDEKYDGMCEKYFDAGRGNIEAR